MTELDELIQRIPKDAVIATTGGENVESRKVLIRPATSVEKEGHGFDTNYMIDSCPGCGCPIPVVYFKKLDVLLISVHGVFTPSHGDILCDYGGESLQFQGDLPLCHN